MPRRNRNGGHRPKPGGFGRLPRNLKAKMGRPRPVETVMDDGTKFYDHEQRDYKLWRTARKT
jgi:hypothetical protein